MFENFSWEPSSPTASSPASTSSFSSWSSSPPSSPPLSPLASPPASHFTESYLTTTLAALTLPSPASSDDESSSSDSEHERSDSESELESQERRWKRQSFMRMQTDEAMLRSLGELVKKVLPEERERRRAGVTVDGGIGKRRNKSRSRKRVVVE